MCKIYLQYLSDHPTALSLESSKTFHSSLADLHCPVLLYLVNCMISHDHFKLQLKLHGNHRFGHFKYIQKHVHVQLALSLTAYMATNVVLNL